MKSEVWVKPISSTLTGVPTFRVSIEILYKLYGRVDQFAIQNNSSLGKCFSIFFCKSELLFPKILWVFTGTQIFNLSSGVL